MRAHDRRVEHLDQVRGRTHRGKRVEEGFEDASLAQSVEAFPHAVPRTKAFRQGAPSNVLDREEMERLKEAPVIVGLSSTPGRQARNTASVCVQSSSFIFVDMRRGLRFARRPMNHA
jgi:hypothetical protein